MPEVEHARRNEGPTLIESWVTRTALVVLDMCALVALAPPNPRVLLAGLTLVGLSIALYRGVSIGRPVSIHIGRRPGWAVVSACVAFAVIVAWPFVPLRGPVYVYVSDSMNPWRSATRPVGADGRGRVFVLTDPLRRQLLPAAEALVGSGIRTVEERVQGGRRYLVIPLIAAVRVVERGPLASTGVEHVVVPIQGMGVNLEMLGAYPLGNNGAITIGLSPFGGILLSFDRELSPQSQAWDWVEVGTTVRAADIRYVGLVDSGIEALARGRTSTGIDLLEQAGVVAPNGTEHSRTLILLGNVFNEYLGGNVGCLQALTVFNAAYAGVVAGGVSSFGAGPPYSWMARELLDEYSVFDSVFESRRSTLRAILSSAPDTNAAGARDYGAWVSRTLFEMSTPEFASIAETIARGGGAESDRQLFAALGPGAVIGLGPLRLLGQGKMADGWREMDRRAAAVRRAVRVLPRSSAKRTEEMLEFSGRVASLARASVLPESTRSREGDRLLSFCVTEYRVAGMERMAEALGEVESSAKGPGRSVREVNAALSGLGDRELGAPERGARWWSSDYIDFALASVTAVIGRAATIDTNGIADDEMRRMVSIEDLEGDSEGDTFVPGIVAIARLLELKPSRLHDSLKAVADRSLGIGYDKLVNVRVFAKADSLTHEIVNGKPRTIAIRFPQLGRAGRARSR